jgi:hypothetical protein
MKTSEFAWLSIRSLGLILAIASIKFGIGMGFGIYLANPYRDYSSVTVASSEPIPSEEDANNPETKQKYDLYNYYNQIAVNNGVWFFLLAGSGLYLLLGGRIVHRIVTRFPDDKTSSEQGVAPQSATRFESESQGGHKPQPESEARSR